MRLKRLVNAICVFSHHWMFEHIRGCLHLENEDLEATLAGLYAIPKMYTITK